MRFLVHGYRVYRVLDSKVFELAVVIGGVLMKNGDCIAIARDVDALKPRIELDDSRAACQRQKRNGDVLVQIEDGHQFVSLTGKERAVVLRVKRHAVISLAFPDRVPAYNFVGRGINDSKNVLVLEVHVDLPRHGIVLRHPRFAVKVQSLHDLVFVYIDDCFGFPSLIRNVQFVKGSSVRSEEHTSELQSHHDLVCRLLLEKKKKKKKKKKIKENR